MRLALVTAFTAKDLDQDLEAVCDAARALSWRPEICCWDDASVDWSSFDAALLRSTWDYPYRLEEFVAWVARAARATRLFNPADLVRWNVDKRYLLGLAEAGIPIIGTRLIEPGSPIDVSDRAEFIVKPSVGAGASGAQRFAPGDLEAARAHIQQLHATGKTALIQPYLARIERDGETGLVFFNGEFSHAIRKQALLPARGPRAQIGTPDSAISARVPRDNEIRVAEQVLASVPGGIPLYARVDLITDDHGQPRLLELEVTEPSLFFDTCPEAALRLLNALAARLEHPNAVESQRPGTRS